MSDTSTPMLMSFAVVVFAAMLWLVTLPVKANAGMAIISFI